ncbi:MAG: hypothetical protein WAR79_03880 [Melioribacteraceae bacterium]
MVNKTILTEEQRKIDIIQKWLRESIEPFDYWDYDGEELLILKKGRMPERYSKEDMKIFIKDF